MTDSLRVLVVDDQPAVVTALGVLFDLHDIPSIGAASPKEARRIAARATSRTARAAAVGVAPRRRPSSPIV